MLVSNKKGKHIETTLNLLPVALRTDTLTANWKTVTGTGFDLCPHLHPTEAESVMGDCSWVVFFKLR